MKILFLSAANSVHTVRWVNALADKKHKVVLVSQKNHCDDRNIISKKVKVVYLPVSGIKGYYLNAYALRKLYQGKQFDIVNVHYASGYGTLARMAKLPGIILNVWGSDVYDFPYESKLKRIIIKRNLSYADVLASTSCSMAVQTEKFLKQRKKIEITPFGVDTEKFKPEKKECKKKEFIFGTVKLISPKYGIDTIIRSFMIFLKKIDGNERNTIKLKIYGKGESEKELKQLVKKLHLEKLVSFQGFIDNDKVPQALTEMDVFLLGSRMNSESFGVSAVEAMACELPVVATRVSGFKEVMEDEKTGFLVPVDNAEAMADKMFALYRNGEIRKTMGKRGRQRVEKLYDWKKNVQRMIQIYETQRGKTIL